MKIDQIEPINYIKFFKLFVYIIGYDRHIFIFKFNQIPSKPQNFKFITFIH